MENTILVGERLLVDKVAYGPHGGRVGGLLPYREIRRGEVIVFACDSQWEWAAGAAKRILLFPIRARLSRMFLPVN